MATSVMLLDCAELTHWKCEEQFGELFTFRLDYIGLDFAETEARDSIGLLETEWNDFDRLTPAPRWCTRPVA